MAARPHRFLAVALLGGALFASAAPTPVYAQEEGVTLDPGDPAAKEYALPHAEARREASGASEAPTQQGSSDAELFGEGVSRADGSDSSTSASKASSAGSGEGGAGANPTTPSAATTSTDPAATGDDPVEAGGVGSTAVLVGGGLVALVLAAGGGVALRALRGPDQ